jgi:hypothetical protein
MGTPGRGSNTGPYPSFDGKILGKKKNQGGSSSKSSVAQVAKFCVHLHYDLNCSIYIR